jgi:cytidine deaminase
MDFNELITHAKSVLGSRKVNEDVWVGSVAAAILSDSGKVYTGVCIDMPCSIGFCAEHAAIAAMITAGESKIMKIVAISEDGILPPCGRCREFICQIHKDNIDTEVLIAPDKSMKLDDLLPYRWNG